MTHDAKRGLRPQSGTAHPRTAADHAHLVRPVRVRSTAAELIPVEQRFPLAENLAILDQHVLAVRRKVYLAYLLIAGVNDSGDL